VITPAQTNLSAGSYSFTVTDAKNCTCGVAVTIAQATSLTASAAPSPVSCNGGSNGSVVITPSGGTSPYVITPAQTNLSAGSYSFTVTDANNCTFVLPVTIAQPVALTASAAPSPVSCNGGSNGSVVITPSGGTSPYVITPAQTNLSAGSYSFTVTDA